ncbi:MAG: hypothetical protein H8K03_18985 [Nitrospira sp.]|jgi:hypothetical protein|nr:hypothetical protein [Nitrospira sp. BO4]
MVEKSVVSSQETQPADWNADDQNLLAATLLATPVQRLAWLEEILHLAYASGALKPRRFISKGEWDAMGSSSE